MHASSYRASTWFYPPSKSVTGTIMSSSTSAYFPSTSLSSHYPQPVQLTSLFLSLPPSISTSSNSRALHDSADLSRLSLCHPHPLPPCTFPLKTASCAHGLSAVWSFPAPNSPAPQLTVPASASHPQKPTSPPQTSPHPSPANSGFLPFGSKSIYMSLASGGKPQSV